METELIGDRQQLELERDMARQLARLQSNRGNEEAAQRLADIADDYDLELDEMRCKECGEPSNRKEYCESCIAAWGE